MSTVDLGEVRPDYTLSSNPPNPKTSFRQGDWICPSPKCAAHNFGRNLSCIGCGAPRSPTSTPSSSSLPSTNICRPSLASPRFTTTPTAPPSAPTSTTTTTTYYSSNLVPPQPSPPSSASTTTTPPLNVNNNNSSKSPHPLLTPSGRAFAVGGKVQNISSDPLNPCIMYWPDNEPFPDQGQIRPSGLVGVPQPPILNTGNRGPISHQPGDWICQKCNYLNWRRRKVCQTCLPYAEGNGDSISAAVQAERIALLTNVLAQTRLDTSGHLQVPINVPPAAPASAPGQLGAGKSSFTPLQNLPNVQQHAQTQRSHSQTPPHVNERRAFLDVPFPHISQQLQQNHSLLNPLGHGSNRVVHRSQSHFALGQHYAQAQAAVATVQAQQQHLADGLHQQRRLAPSPTPTPIYQTPLPQQQQPSRSQTIPPIQTQLYPQPQRPIERRPSPLPSLGMPLLYATGPGGATGMFMNGEALNPGLGAGLQGHGRTRVLSSPAGPIGMGARGVEGSLVYGTGPTGTTSLEAHNHVRERRGSEELTKSRGVVGTSVGENTISPTTETLTTPASATPLLPAFLQDIVRRGVSASDPNDVDDGEVLNGQSALDVDSPGTEEGDRRHPTHISRSFDVGGSATPVPVLKSTSSIIGRANTPTTVQAPGSAHIIHPRTRNDSGSSTSSGFSTSTSDCTSASSSSSTSLLSVPLSGSPPSSACTPTTTSTAGNPGSNSNSNSGAGFFNFNLGMVPGVGSIGGGIWSMDGDESRNLGWASSSGPSGPGSGLKQQGSGLGYIHGNSSGSMVSVGTELKGI